MPTGWQIRVLEFFLQMLQFGQKSAEKGLGLRNRARGLGLGFPTQGRHRGWDPRALGLVPRPMGIIWGWTEPKLHSDQQPIL